MHSTVRMDPCFSWLYKYSGICHLCSVICVLKWEVEIIEKDCLVFCWSGLTLQGSLSTQRSLINDRFYCISCGWGYESYIPVYIYIPLTRVICSWILTEISPLFISNANLLTADQLAADTSQSSLNYCKRSLNYLHSRNYGGSQTVHGGSQFAPMDMYLALIRVHLGQRKIHN